MLSTDEPVASSPTIQQFEAEPQATALRPVFNPGGNEDTTDHDVPSHWRGTAEVLSGVPGPTAQHAEDDVQVTELSPSEVGDDTVDHEVPFQWTMKAWGTGLPLLELSVPTAQQSEELVQVIAPREVLS